MHHSLFLLFGEADDAAGRPCELTADSSHLGNCAIISGATCCMIEAGMSIWFDIISLYMKHIIERH